MTWRKSKTTTVIAVVGAVITRLLAEHFFMTFSTACGTREPGGSFTGYQLSWIFIGASVGLAFVAGTYFGSTPRRRVLVGPYLPASRETSSFF